MGSYEKVFFILSNKEDPEGSVNDTYLAAWNNMPSRRPNALSAFLGKLTRHIAGKPAMPIREAAGKLS